MTVGRVLAIFTAARKRDDLHAVEEIELVPGRGLHGDRYSRRGEPDALGNPSQEVTLIESEALDFLKREHGIELAPSQTRRNLLTRGVALNDLVGQEFTVGDVLLRGLELCHPCDHLEAMTYAGVKEGLKMRGGLRAEILRGGILRPGAVLRAEDAG
jgi:MOSC domain-containing protein YiiM